MSDRANRVPTQAERRNAMAFSLLKVVVNDSAFLQYLGASKEDAYSAAAKMTFDLADAMLAEGQKRAAIDNVPS